MSAETTSTPPPGDPAPPTAPAPAPSVAPAAKKPIPWRKAVLIVVAIVALAVGIPAVLHSFRFISTDDAYVNSYVTFVAPRVAGQVEKVFVEDNNRVKKGDVLVQLDPEPYAIKVAIKQSALDAANANLAETLANVQSLVAQARSDRFKLEHAIEEVDNQIALIRQRAATVDQSKASLKLAQAEFERSKSLLGKKVVSQEEFDRANESLSVAQAQVTQSLENVYQARAALGLPSEPAEGKSLTDVPEDLDQTFSSVREALAELMHSVAQLGVVSSSFNLTPKQAIAEFYKRDASGDIDRIYATVIKNAPSLKQAQVAVEQAQHDLDQARLDLRYTQIVSEIDGVVTRRNVNPGNNVQIGQSLMAVRSLSDLWVDANFKETQLRDLRIGQRVELTTDMYGGHQTFEGRISGFTNGTGSTLALLPAQNATGNFVKVVQRLPVRIDLVNYDPDRTPLFVGLSVEPEVDIKSQPEGPNAGRFLQNPAAK
ncbi:MAG TPA: HlyD family secretion protein [Chthoniobacterales bacterium]|nr:HlyD family secretion protein [Chthoniobacterales bacterium]